MRREIETVCDGCGHVSIGHGRADLLRAGWKIHHVRSGEPFVLCGDCIKEYAARRATRAALERPDSDAA